VPDLSGDIRKLRYNDVSNYKDGNLVYLNPNDIKFDEDIYPRKHGHNQALIDEYATESNFAMLPPSLVNQRGYQLDGYHRIKAAIKRGETKIPCILRVTKSKAEDRSIARRANSKHGWKLSKEDKVAIALEDWDIIPIPELADDLGVEPRTIYNWTEAPRAKKKAELEAKVGSTLKNMWLACEPNKIIAETLSKITGEEWSDQNVRDAIKVIYNPAKDVYPELSRFEDFRDEEYEDYNEDNLELSSDWYCANGFESLPTNVIENLLCKLTKPADIVFAPLMDDWDFDIVDICGDRFLKHYVCSKEPGGDGVRKHDILTGLPKDLPAPNLVFLNVKSSSDATPAQVGEIARELKSKFAKSLIRLVLITPQPMSFDLMSLDDKDKDLSRDYSNAVERYFEYHQKISLTSNLKCEWDDDDIKNARDTNKNLGVHRDVFIFAKKPELEVPKAKSEPKKKTDEEVVGDMLKNHNNNKENKSKAKPASGDKK